MSRVSNLASSRRHDPPHSLGRQLGFTAGATSPIVERMLLAGLLVTSPDPDDRRAVVIRLTPQGEALRHLEGLYVQGDAVLLEGLTEREAERLFALLARTEANARCWLSAGTAIDPMAPPSPQAA